MKCESIEVLKKVKWVLLIWSSGDEWTLTAFFKQGVPFRFGKKKRGQVLYFLVSFKLNFSEPAIEYLPFAIASKANDSVYWL